MKVQIICENCNKVVELTPKTNGQHANFHSISDYFRADVDIENSISDNLDESFITTLAENSDEDDIRSILENEISYNVNVDNELHELRINCTNCGNYIILNEF